VWELGQGLAEPVLPAELASAKAPDLSCQHQMYWHRLSVLHLVVLHLH